MSYTGNLGILLSNPILSIDNKDTYVSSFYGSYSPYDHVVLKSIFYLVLSTQSRCINKYVFLAVVLNLSVYGISGGSGNIRNNKPVFAYKLVDYGALSYIGLTNYGNLDGIVLFLSSRIFGKVAYHLFKQISKPLLVNCRYRERFSDPEVIKLIDIK